jgi:DNA replication and repair protein RecF
MRVEALRIDGLRNLAGVSISPAPGLNLLTGRNGAGKTSVLEALHLLAHGRSFRTAQLDALVGHGATGFSVYARLDGEQKPRSLGLLRQQDGWQMAHDGQPVATLLEFVSALAVVSMDPECHALISGPAESRRRFLDWLLFHVEPDFLPVWRRYLRALRQRNAALRAGGPERAVAAWEPELATTGEAINAYRSALVAPLASAARAMMDRMQGELPAFDVRFRPGWTQEATLLDALMTGRGADRERGFTQRGPHRADWRLVFDTDLDQRQLSRGQAKLVALCCLAAQAELYRDRARKWPVLAFDDLASELDAERQQTVLSWAAEAGAQVFITGTAPPAGWVDLNGPAGMFHVEQGRVAPLV